MGSFSAKSCKISRHDRKCFGRLSDEGSCSAGLGNGTKTPGYYTYNGHSDVEAVTGNSGDTMSTYGYTAYGQNDTSQFTGKDKNNTTPGGSTPQSLVNRTALDIMAGRNDVVMIGGAEAWRTRMPGRSPWRS